MDMESVYDSAEDYGDEDCPMEVEAEIEALRGEFERVRKETPVFTERSLSGLGSQVV
jgi:hypothetical protein